MLYLIARLLGDFSSVRKGVIGKRVVRQLSGTASEVAQLKLNADWVILSACDTASSDGTPGAEGLSGLAKAFFYAGSRALLVSHWPVLTDAATALTMRMLREAMDKTIGRAEALKRSMMALMQTPEKPYYAHPMFWAPFSVVGEGGR